MTRPTRSEIIERWRKAKPSNGRLYWRTNNPHWRDWDRGEIAQCINGPVRTHYYTLEAILDDIEHAEYWRAKERDQ